MRAKKRFGQHFLHTEGIIERFMAFVKLGEFDHVCEIGPGHGALTTHVFPPRCACLDVVELDRDLLPKLHGFAEKHPGMHVHHEDIMDFDLKPLIDASGGKLRVLGNLPYYLTTPIIFKLFEYSGIQDMFFLLQKEVVRRLVARPGSSDYGRLSVMAQYQAEVEALFEVGPEHFSPPPKVWSEFVVLRPRPFACIAKNVALFSELVRIAFSQRRKMLKRSLSDRVSQAVWTSVGIDPTLRPEQLSVEAWVSLSNRVNDDN